MDKLNVAVLFGGCSSEYSVSLESAHAVIEHIDQSKFNPVMIGISSKGSWFHYTGPIQNIVSDTWENPEDCTPAVVSPDRDAHELLVLRKDGVTHIHLDAAFPVLHGKNGEDGTVQGVFALAGISLVGCGVLSSSLCMDKDRAHKLAHVAGVSVPNSFLLTREIGAADALAGAKQIGYPLFVKPVKAGSSYGITKVTKRDELPAAIKSAFEYDDQVIVEEAISGFEVGCAVLGNDTLTVGELDEIELSSDFFSFAEKYTLKTSAIHVPARIPRAKTKEIKRTAKVIYRALGCQGFARVDLFLDGDGRIIFNEVNTIPGFTAHSRYPSMMKAVGMSFGQVITAVIALAVAQ